MKTAICVIGRMENAYAVEFVEYYKKLGFDKIFIFDNNYDGEEHFEDVLSEYISNCFVTIINFRNIENSQIKAYEIFYKTFGKKYDWIAFFDFDEYLTIKNGDNIKEYLSKFENFDCVLINWMVYGDNDLVCYDNRPLQERFKKPLNYDIKIEYSFPENNHVKIIVRGGLGEISFDTPHVIKNNVRFCNASGKQCEPYIFQQYDFDVAYIKHYATKTIQEWTERKMKVGTPDRTYDVFLQTYTNRFFKYNKFTEEKQKILNSLNI